MTPDPAGAGPAPGPALGERTWPEVGRWAAEHRALVVVPLGATEQHGPHLPLSVDTDVAVELGRRLAARRPDALVTPPIAFGASGEHAGFPGTLSIGVEALELVLVELGRSAGAFAGLVLVNAHGGNRAALGSAETRLRAEGRHVLAWSARWRGDAHAGRTETSLALALVPGLVRPERAEPGNPRPVGELMAELRRSSVRAVSPNGVLGDPARASAAEGRALLADLESDLVRAVECWHGPSPTSSPAPGRPAGAVAPGR